MKLSLCPVCHGWLHLKKKSCRRCAVDYEAEFEENPLVMLAREEQDFILDFVLCGGNFKALAEGMGLSYPTVRSHLDRIIEKLNLISRALTTDEVLDAIDEGRIRPEQGIEKLRRLRGEAKHEESA